MCLGLFLLRVCTTHLYFNLANLFQDQLYEKHCVGLMKIKDECHIPFPRELFKEETDKPQLHVHQI
jgi:hypothetical protein